MDIITLAMAKAYADSKGGYTEKNVFSWDGNTDGKVTYSDVLFKVSDKTPDASTVVRIKGTWAGMEVEYGADSLAVQEAEFGNIIVLTMAGGGIPAAIVCTEAKLGVPETGLYLLALDEEHRVTYIEFAETIHPIDQKFLPGVVDFDKLGITSVVLELFNAGGGEMLITKDNAYGIDIEETKQAFPKDRPPTAKMTIPGMGTMFVNSVYASFGTMEINGVSFNEIGGVTHYDSYLMQDGGLLKFYARVHLTALGASSTGVDCVHVEVGFY